MTTAPNAAGSSVVPAVTTATRAIADAGADVSEAVGMSRRPAREGGSDVAGTGIELRSFREKSSARHEIHL